MCTGRLSGRAWFGKKSLGGDSCGLLSAVAPSDVTECSPFSDKLSVTVFSIILPLSSPSPLPLPVLLPCSSTKMDYGPR